MRSDLAPHPSGNVQSAEWGAIFGQTGNGAGIPLGTARWLAPEAAAGRFAYEASLFRDRVWIGDGFDAAASPLGYGDDRHVCLASGSRGGKGVGVIVPNLCFWPGSCIVVDPKGENATVTARRRGGGSAYAHGLGQKVCILDPFGEVQLPAALKARYNPLDAIDPESELAIDDAARVAAALVVVENRNDPYWEEAARNLIRGLILHVLSAPYLRAHRNLVTVRRLLTQGDWLTVEKMGDAGNGTDDMPSAFEVLWTRMRRNRAFNGVVAGAGEQMIAMADKQRSGVLEAARTSTEFLDSIPMQRLLAASDFDLAELKTNAQGLTVYLTLPQRFMETHYRWLRLMIVLAIGEMERIKGRPATGHPTLFLLDEFAGLKRMEVIENAAAQAAGFGIKFLFVVQNLPQLEDLYEKSWETFLGNSGLKLFFQIDDDFTRSYVSRQLGDLETVRRSQSGSQSHGTSDSDTEGYSHSDTEGHATSRRPILHFRTSKQSSTGQTRSWSSSRSRGSSASATEGWSEAVHKRPLLNPDEIGRLLARIDDRRRPGYPGLVLALIPGEHPLLARRVNYFESPRFIGYFDPHPNHPPPPTLAELAADAARRAAEQVEPLPPPAPPPGRQLTAGQILTRVFWAGVAAFVVIVTLIHLSPGPGAGGDTAPADTSEPPAQSAAYARGVADWNAVQKWFLAQSGDRRAGAEYWAANRSVGEGGSCADAAWSYSGDQRLFTAGCDDARRLLKQVDENRANPEYRAGFNDAAKRPR
ncbi:MAG TPA: type IV secretory system conjugative DNA transfer family protein [Stellaceae bacterium]|nr:type IV secretory system conjugative DNA transfer family protein [Stellaceae bacterium]